MNIISMKSFDISCDIFKHFFGYKSDYLNKLNSLSEEYKKNIYNLIRLKEIDEYDKWEKEIKKCILQFNKNNKNEELCLNILKIHQIKKCR